MKKKIISMQKINIKSFIPYLLIFGLFAISACKGNEGGNEYEDDDDEDTGQKHLNDNNQQGNLMNQELKSAISSPQIDFALKQANIPTQIKEYVPLIPKLGKMKLSELYTNYTTKVLDENLKKFITKFFKTQGNMSPEIIKNALKCMGITTLNSLTDTINSGALNNLFFSFMGIDIKDINIQEVKPGDIPSLDDQKDYNTNDIDENQYKGIYDQEAYENFIKDMQKLNIPDSDLRKKLKTNVKYIPTQSTFGKEHKINKTGTLRTMFADPKKGVRTDESGCGFLSLLGGLSITSGKVLSPEFIRKVAENYLNWSTKLPDLEPLISNAIDKDKDVSEEEKKTITALLSATLETVINHAGMGISIPDYAKLEGFESILKNDLNSFKTEIEKQLIQGKPVMLLQNGGTHYNLMVKIENDYYIIETTKEITKINDLDDHLRSKVGNWNSSYVKSIIDRQLGSCLPVNLYNFLSAKELPQQVTNLIKQMLTNNNSFGAIYFNKN